MVEWIDVRDVMHNDRHTLQACSTARSVMDLFGDVF